MSNCSKCSTLFFGITFIGTYIQMQTFFHAFLTPTTNKNGKKSVYVPRQKVVFVSSTYLHTQIP
jgi:hypothetical protein